MKSASKKETLLDSCEAEEPLKQKCYDDDVDRKFKVTSLVIVLKIWKVFLKRALT